MIHIPRLLLFLPILCALLLGTVPGVTRAETTPVDIPATSANDASISTYPIMRLSQDRSEMIKLDQEAASIIVGNPAHLSVLLDTEKTIIVVPKASGASHFSVLGKEGDVILQRQVIVGGPKNNYVRIRRSCAGNSSTCRPTSTYFCPDTCHEVAENP
ncbi:MAG: pilus assembly protein N-terminal domain-containing protein [Alphaproteobacteria bacterium]|nr:pilus assembly protein N-terminal domain-containing protein [Alphaproteobacteria bacterium]